LRPDWLPGNITPVLEELPKWEYLVETLLEIEDLIMRYPVPVGMFTITSLWRRMIRSWSLDHPGTNVVLIMCSSDRTSNLVQDFLSTMDPMAAPGTKGRKLMEKKLRSYLFWKGKLGSEGKAASNSDPAKPPGVELAGISDALKKKDARNKERQGSRRRTRGGPPNLNATSRTVGERSMDPGLRSGAMGGEGIVREEADELALL
jgi:DNA excision repair protein ERCC-4